MSDNEKGAVVVLDPNDHSEPIQAPEIRSARAIDRVEMEARKKALISPGALMFGAH